MWAVIVEHPGPPEVLRYCEVPTPLVRSGWSLVRVRAAGVNHSEVFTRQGLSPTVTFPRILGIECVGEVAASSTPDLVPGQRVVSLMGELGRAFDGGYAQYVLLPNERIIPVQTSLDWESLGAVPETYATAYGSLKQLAMRDGMSLLVRAATSGVGIATVRLAAALYPHSMIAGTTRNPRKADMLRDHGYQRVHIDQSGRLPDAGRYDRVLDLVGPAAARDSFEHIEQGGIVCSTGQLGGQWTLDDFDPIMDTHGGYLTGYHSQDADAALIQELLDVIADRRIDVRPRVVLSLSQASQAHRLLEQSCGCGKVVLVPES